MVDSTPNSERTSGSDLRLDRTDFALLGLLQNDARLSNKELAQRVHLAPSSCLERVRRLRESGVLGGAHAVVEPEAIGIGLQALIAVQLDRHTDAIVKEFRTYLFTSEAVIAAFYLAGRTDFLIHVAVRDTKHLRDLAVDFLTARPEVAHVETSLIFEHTDRHALPIYQSATT
ncbi:MAG: Lrp/AsnC family transcriptional regulator [Planctomycetota bacterium]